MDIPGTTLEIQTLGRFKISVDGKTVAADWPNESVKILFCSLLSPLDIYFTWDRVCRSILGEPVTSGNRSRLEELVIRPLDSFLIKETGFKPLIADKDSIRLNYQGIHVDAHEFYSTVIDGLRMLSDSNNTAALEKFKKADSLYTGSYLPGISGNIIENTRHELEALYRTAVMDSMPVVRKSRSMGYYLKPVVSHPEFLDENKLVHAVAVK